jgi:hypothetical protein
LKNSPSSSSLASYRGVLFSYTNRRYYKSGRLFCLQKVCGLLLLLLLLRLLLLLLLLLRLLLLHACRKQLHGQWPRDNIMAEFVRLAFLNCKDSYESISLYVLLSASAIYDARKYIILIMVNLAFLRVRVNFRPREEREGESSERKKIYIYI